MHYSFDDIRNAYEGIGVTKGSTVMLRTDFRSLGFFENGDKERMLFAHFDVLADLVDLSKGTIVVGTSSTYLCDTDKPFDVENTPSERGLLTEFFRTRESAVRSFHPFMSYSAVGKNAGHICNNVSRHPYGPETPKDRLLDLNARCVSVGLHPRFTCTIVHHIEFLVGVPYRYVKEFIHPVVRNGKIIREPFYLYVWYKECNIKRNYNVKIFNRFFKEGYTIQDHGLGRGKVYGYSMVDFYRSTIQAFRDDIYIWTEEPPKIRPYQR